MNVALPVGVGDVDEEQPSKTVRQASLKAVESSQELANLKSWARVGRVYILFLAAICGHLDDGLTNVFIDFVAFCFYDIDFPSILVLFELIVRRQDARRITLKSS